MADFNLFSEGFGDVAGAFQTSGMKLFAKLVHGSIPLTMFAESSILDVWLFLAMLICLEIMGKNLQIDY